jgi:hypothetical protein
VDLERLENKFGQQFHALDQLPKVIQSGYSSAIAYSSSSCDENSSSICDDAECDKPIDI